MQEFLRGRNPRTQRAYQKDFEDFARFLGVENIEKAARLLIERGHGNANGLALNYRAHLVERKLQPSTINRRLAALRSVVAFAQTIGEIEWSLKVRNLKAQTYRDMRGPGRAGFHQLLEAAGRERDRAILRLLHDLGLRRGEVVGLDLDDLNLDESALWILGKGRTQKERLTLPEPTRAALAAWIAVRGSTPGALFTNRDRARKGDGRLTGGSVWHIVREIGKRAGLITRPHGLRHSGITEALDATNGNVRAVQRFSRHRDVRILTVYDDNRLYLAGDVAKLVAV